MQAQYELVNQTVDTPPALRTLRVMWAAIQNVLMGGVVYGYAALGPMLRAHATLGGCGLSSAYCQVMFFAAVCASGLSPLASGAVLDLAGPRGASVFFTGLFACGAYLFSVSENHSFNLFIPGLILMAFAGPGVSQAASYTSAYFPNRGSLVATLLSMSFHLSFLVFYAINYMWENTTDKRHPMRTDGYRYAFESLALLAAGSALISVIIHSNEGSAFVRLHVATAEQAEPINASKMTASAPAPAAVASGGSFGSAGNGEGQAIAIAIAPLTNEDRHLYTGDLSASAGASTDCADVAATASSAGQYNAYWNLSLEEKLTSKAFLRLAFFFAMTTFFINFYVGTVEASLGDSLLLPFRAQRAAAQEFSVVLASGFLAIPLFNMLLERHGRMLFPVLLAGYAVLSAVWSMCLLWDTSAAVLPTFICYSLLRTLLFCFMYPYCQDLFGPHYRDVIIGMLHLIAGVVGLGMIPLALWANGTCSERLIELELHKCSQGRWESVSVLKACSSVYVAYFAFKEWTSRRHYFREQQQQEALLLSRGQGQGYYGALDDRDVEMMPK